MRVQVQQHSISSIIGTNHVIFIPVLGYSQSKLLTQLFIHKLHERTGPAEIFNQILKLLSE